MSVGRVKEISVFVDESGSFESDEESSRYYLICLLFHDQSVDIAEWLANLQNYLAATDLGSEHCVHVGPLIRREAEYANMRREDRKAIFRKMMAFVRKADISYRCFKIDKHFNTADAAVHDSLRNELTRFLSERVEFFSSYDRLKVYYDGGQRQVSDLLREVFQMYSSIVEYVPNVRPENYRLFQAADLLCSIELVAVKIDAGEKLTTSEIRFFGSERDFKREILRQIRRKEMV